MEHQKRNIAPHYICVKMGQMRGNFLTLVIFSAILFSSDGLTECPKNCSCEIEIMCKFSLSGESANIFVPNISHIISLNVTSNSLRNADNLLSNKPNLRALSITGSYLKSAPILPHLPSLYEYNLSNTLLQEIQPEAIANNNQISRLNFSNNNLNIIHANTFHKFHNLTILDLSDNEQLKTIPKELFTQNENLQVLILSRTGLSSISPSTLSGFKNLRTLNLSYNKINFMKIEGGTTELEVLDLSNNPLRTLPNLSKFPNLRELHVSNTLIIDLNKNMLSQCGKLEKLILRSSRITYLKRNTFSQCRNLRILDLSSNYYLGELEYEAFNGLKSLRILKLNDCPNLLELQEAIFEDLAELQEIHLQNNNIRVLPNSLFKLSNLNWLNLKGNFILCDCHAGTLAEIQPILGRYNHKIVDCVDGGRKTIGEIMEQVEKLNCQHVQISSNEDRWNLVKWGDNALLECQASGHPRPDIIWQTVDRNLQVMNKDALGREWLPSRIMNALHIASENEDKLEVLPSGHLLIKNVTRQDIGRYKCFAFNSFSNSSGVAFLGLDDRQFRMFIIESILIGFACATAFLLITLLVQAINFIMMRCGWFCCCCEKRLTKKAQQIRQLIETIESHRSTQLDRLKENYNSQVASIKDGCYQQMERVRESYSQQSKNLKDLCDYSSQQITGVRDQYLDQLNKIREYSLSQMSRVRENYVFQRNRIRKFSSHQMLRIRETYKYQQKTLNKLLENLPDLYVQACRTGTCRRTNSFTYDDDYDEEMGNCDDYYHVDFLVDNQSFGSRYFTPVGTLTKKEKRAIFKKHSRNVSQASSNGGGVEMGGPLWWFTPRGSIAGDSPPRAHFAFELAATAAAKRSPDTTEVKAGHRRCYSLSENFAKVPLFQLNSVVVEEGDACPPSSPPPIDAIVTVTTNNNNSGGSQSITVSNVSHV